MRTLALILYAVVLGFLLLSSYIVDLFGNDYYSEDLSETFLQYNKVVSPALEKELLANPGEHLQILSTWSQIISDSENAIEIIPHNRKDKTAYVENVDFTEQTDTITVIQPLLDESFAGKALRIEFTDSYSDGVLELYVAGYTAIYILMALMLTAVAWVVYRYINRICKVTESVAAGRFDLKMPDSRVPALHKLATDINTMAETIEEKTQENLILTGAIHHELRIPITRIRLALDMALGGNTDEFIKELLSGMDDDLEELSTLMEELLTISRLRLKGVEEGIETLDVSQIIEKTVKDIGSEKIYCETLCVFALEANHTLLERAIYNILSNAVKYAEKRVEVATTTINGQYVLTISDDGPGIPEDERAFVFKPFYRVDKSRNRTTGGFGLGLAIADMVLKDTHGTIVIDDSPLGGARFKISWPIIHKT